MPAPTAEHRLAVLERQLGIEEPTIELQHPGRGCHFCGLAVATALSPDGAAWLPHGPNSASDACIDCYRDAHEFGFDNSPWRAPEEHRDLVVNRLVGKKGFGSRVGRDVGWRWFHEQPDLEGQEERFGWVDLDDLKAAVDPPPHVCDPGQRCWNFHRQLLPRSIDDRFPNMRQWEDRDRSERIGVLHQRLGE